jgi:hypothetical protein
LFLNQEQTPVCTAISLLTTALVEVYLLMVPSIEWGPFGGAFALVFTALVLLIGIAANTLAGRIAATRSEYFGGRIAILGVALWLVTIAVWFATPSKQ